MNANELPIGQTMVVIDKDYIRVFVTRNTEREAICEYTDPETDRAVLRTRLDVHDGTSVLEHMDLSFWDVVLDGKPMGVGMIPEQANMQADPEKRILYINTK